MFERYSIRMRRVTLLALAASLAGLAGLAGAAAQAPEATEADRARAFKLYEEGKYLDALPIFEKLAAAKPDDYSLVKHYGICLLSYSSGIKDDEERKATRVRARKQLLRAQELGDPSDLLKVLLDDIPPDGSFSAFSARKDVDDTMRRGEEAFSKGDYDRALAEYRLALVLDPNQYEAALFAGDVYFRRKDWNQAGVWFAQAIGNDPDRETAFRYWADALMEDGKREEARAKYVEAYLCEPYKQATWLALGGWGKVTGASVAHPRIETPATVSRKGETTEIDIDPAVIGRNDGSAAWMGYGMQRALWQKEKFAKEFPDEKAYRHTLREEADALTSVVKIVSEMAGKGKIKDLDPSLATLVELNKNGLLEAYVLLARADAGIARDYAGYRKDHRDQLRRYVAEYVIHPAPAAQPSP